MFYRKSKKIYMIIILLAAIICSCIRPVETEISVMPRISSSISSGISGNCEDNIITVLKSSVLRSVVYKQEKNKTAAGRFTEFCLIVIAVFSVFMFVSGTIRYFRHRKIIKLWRVIGYIHKLDGEKGGFIFYGC